jgi:uncharacterized protein DUF4410
MKPLLLGFFLVFLGTHEFQSQVEPTRVIVRAILVDKDLAQKPAPHLTITFTPGEGSADEPTGVKTGFDGSAETQLKPGKYRLTTPQALDFQGHHYVWELELAISGPSYTVELSNDNAKVTESTPGAPVRKIDELTTPTQTQEKTAAQDKTTVVVHTFSVPTGVQWPYDTKQLQLATIAELKGKSGTRAEVVSEAPENRRRVLILEGEILSWKAGNRATRLMVGLGSGRETAKIHFWLNDASGKKVYEHTDTIRQSVWGGGYSPSAGELLQPFANKIANRIDESKVF